MVHSKMGRGEALDVFSIEAEQDRIEWTIFRNMAPISHVAGIFHFIQVCISIGTCNRPHATEQHPQNVTLQPRRAADNANCDVLGRWSNCDGGFLPHVLRSTTWPILMKVSVTALLDILTLGRF